MINLALFLKDTVIKEIVKSIIINEVKSKAEMLYARVGVLNNTIS